MSLSRLDRSELAAGTEPGWYMDPDGPDFDTRLGQVIADAQDMAGNGPLPTAEEREQALSALSASPNKSWPSPLRAEAFHGIAGDFVRLIEPHTEADPAALLVTFLAGFGNAIGAKPHVMIDGAKHGAKINTVLVGETSSGRKGTAQARSESVVRAADESWTACRASNVASGEVLVWALRDAKGDDPGESEKRMWAVAPEFAGLLATCKRDGSILSPILRDGWDSDALRHTSKVKPSNATGAHITVIGHITPVELRGALTNTEAANGFGNRFLWVCTRRSKSLPRGSLLKNGSLEVLTNRLRTAIDYAKTIGRLEYDGGFWDVFTARYDELTSDRPGLFGAVTGRGAPYIHRLALVYALLDCSPLIERKHAVAAFAVWDYCSASAAHIFGQRLGNPIADAILDALRSEPEGMTRTEISKAFGAGHEKHGPALSLLRDSALAYPVKLSGTGGRAAERWYAA